MALDATAFKFVFRLQPYNLPHIENFKPCSARKIRQK